ncbi:MAG TPA: hypothetical protein VFL91_01810 [Thermomicrobiales bacterium]|nr:hypothetical protein [Thermomicrobiales bacterium]
MTDRPPAPTPLERAQELIYQAWEVPGRRRLALARRALALSPDCADAYVFLAEAARDPAAARQLYEAGVQAGERALGPEIFARHAGDFWALLETRPSMRARQGLAELLWRQGERAAAVAHLTALLALNPHDNQGNRYALVTRLLALGDDEEVARLLAAFPDEWSAWWAYSAALYRFRGLGAGPAADTSLRRALRLNPHVPGYLLGRDRLPRQRPPFYSTGSTSEAVLYAADALAAWRATPGALAWCGAVWARTTARAPRAPGRRQRG